MAPGERIRLATSPVSTDEATTQSTSRIRSSREPSKGVVSEEQPSSVQGCDRKHVQSTNAASNTNESQPSHSKLSDKAPAKHDQPEISRRDTLARPKQARAPTFITTKPTKPVSKPTRLAWIRERIESNEKKTPIQPQHERTPQNACSSSNTPPKGHMAPTMKVQQRSAAQRKAKFAKKGSANRHKQPLPTVPTPRSSRSRYRGLKNELDAQRTHGFYSYQAEHIRHIRIGFPEISSSRKHKSKSPRHISSHRVADTRHAHEISSPKYDQKRKSPRAIPYQQEIGMRNSPGRRASFIEFKPLKLVSSPRKAKVRNINRYLCHSQCFLVWKSCEFKLLGHYTLNMWMNPDRPGFRTLTLVANVTWI